ncbi:MAG: hypothetical protein ACLFTI_11470 [Anaerolineales bacterium]
MPLPKSSIHAASVDASEERGAFRMLAPPVLPMDDAGAPVIALDASLQARIIIVDAAGIAIAENVERVPPTDDEFRLLRE